MKMEPVDPMPESPAGRLGSQDFPITLPRRGLAFRWNLAFGALLLAALAGLLSAGVVEEWRGLRSMALRHLHETGEVLWTHLESHEVAPAGPDLGAMENAMCQSRGVEHRILLVDPAGKVAWASDRALVGQSLDSALGPRTVRGEDGFEVFLGPDRKRWFGSRIDLGMERGEALLLMDAGSVRSAIGAYVRTHLIAAALVLGAAWLLGSWLTRRWVQIPVARLARFIDQVERGNWSLSEAGAAEGDEFGWLARRFAVMAERLEATVRQLVQAERHSSLVVFTTKVARDLEVPLRRLDSDLARLREAASGDPALAELAGKIEGERAGVTQILEGLYRVVPPKEGNRPETKS